MSSFLDLRDEMAALDVSPRALRWFGLAVGGVFLALSTWLAWRSGWDWTSWAIAVAAVGGALVSLGVVVPTALRAPYRAWMMLALVVGVAMSRVILTVFFFLVITPVGIARRVFGESPVRTRPDPTASSYWQRRQPADLERLKRMW